MMQTIGIVALPLALGMLLRVFAFPIVQRLLPVLPLASMLVIAWVMAQMALNQQRILDLPLPVCVVCFTIYSVWFSVMGWRAVSPPTRPIAVPWPSKSACRIRV